MKCQICNNITKKITEQFILNKYRVAYYQCELCKFIQTEEPYWLSEAYENVITNLDIGLVSRNIYLREEIPPIIDALFPESNIMIDYGGGYGLFVRIMRDLGYNFYRQDIYCDNIFANYFDINDAPVKKFDVLTAFEVFEHLSNPIAEIEKMFSLSDNLIFSTELSPSDIKKFDSWWYVAPSTGQHIAFYSLESLEFIANRFNKYLYSNKTNLHILSSKKINKKIIDNIWIKNKPSIVKKVLYKFSFNKSTKKSLLQDDFERILKSLNRGQ